MKQQKKKKDVKKKKKIYEKPQIIHTSVIETLAGTCSPSTTCVPAHD
jgi:hypothetical protein